MKYLFVILLLPFLVIAWLKSSIAQENGDRYPFENFAVMECINSQECTWNYFKNRYIADVNSAVSPEDWRFTIWPSGWHDINIYILRGDNEKHRKEIEGVTSLLDRYLPGKIKIQNKKVNFFVIFSDDIKKDYYEQDRAKLYPMFRDRIQFFDAGFERPTDKKITCDQMNMHNNKRHNIVGVLFVDTDERGRLSCLKKGFISSFSSNHSYKPSFKDHTQQKKSYDINKMDLFLQALMFDPNFIAGMNLNEMKEVFPIAYSDSHNRFYKKLQKEIIE